MQARDSIPESYLALLDALWVRDFSSRPYTQRVAEYCLELANLRTDFDRMDDLLFLFYEWLECEGSDNATAFVRKKFLVVHSEDNIVIRVHAYRERVFQLVNLALELGSSEEKRNLIDDVAQKLQQHGHVLLLACLTTLTQSKTPAIKDALDRRTEFVHRLPKRDWVSLRSGGMLLEWLDLDWDQESFGSKKPHEIQLESDNLRRKFQDIRQFIGSICRELDDFEVGFCRTLYRSYADQKPQ